VVDAAREPAPGRRPPHAVLQFLGAARTVTGSRFLVDGPHADILVDCGLFQGLKPDRLRNWAPFPVDPAGLDAVVLTHAHLDHCGYLPALVRNGFRGPVFATRGTAELARIVLTDSARIQEDDAAYANAEGFSKHHPALPLYDHEDAAAAIERFELRPYYEPFEVAPGMRATFSQAGHILGSAQVLLEVESAGRGRPSRRIVFSGDLGRPSHALLCAPDPPPAADALLVESTYGDRLHDETDLAERFGRIVRETVARGGVVLVPAFAVDRTELVLRMIDELRAAQALPDVPVFVDSPMALAALGVYRRAIAEGWEEIRPELRGDPEPFADSEVTEVRDVEGSRELVQRTGPAIVISASGMATGGRVLHHLLARLADPRNSVALVGYQARGTRGRYLMDGTRSLKLLGRYVPVHAAVHDLSALSVHADQRGLVEWVASAKGRPETVYVVHGEEAASVALRDTITAELDLVAAVPHDLERVRI
jgi:metallo-beta-lactamase family protein